MLDVIVRVTFGFKNLAKGTVNFFHAQLRADAVERTEFGARLKSETMGSRGRTVADRGCAANIRATNTAAIVSATTKKMCCCGPRASRLCADMNPPT